MKEELKVMGSAISLVFTGLIAWTFYTAFFSTNKKVLIDINSIGEANFEFWLMAFCVLLVLYSFYLIFMEYHRKPQSL